MIHATVAPQGEGGSASTPGDSFTITAQLPLGTFRGAAEDGSVERLPSVSRLYSALLCAAGFGPRATPRGDRLQPCPADEAALRWLEENPPDAVSIPAMRVNVGDVTAYRDDGTLKATKTSTKIKKLAKNPDVSVAVAGTFSWTWSQSPPDPVVAALEALAPDVPYLGTTESPVRLVVSRSGTVEPTHVLDEQASFFGSGGEDVEVPVPGRLDELVAAHEAATARPPSKARDKTSSDEQSASYKPPREGVGVARYTTLTPPTGDTPWSLAAVIPLRQPIPVADRVAWAAAVHRALVRIISTAGQGVPPLVTGSYAEGPRPANRVAIQILDRSMPLDPRLALPEDSASALAILIPQDTSPPDLAVLTDALRAVTWLRGPGGRLLHIQDEPQVIDGARLWAPRPVGTVRLWRTAVPAVPDVRGVGSGPWTFAHSALLSLGFVWRDRLGRVQGHGDARYRAIVDAVNARGAVVVRADPVRTNDVHRYAHKVNEHAVIRPYDAVLWLGDLAGEQSVVAIGQARHLGGGLLVPHDHPEGAHVTVSRAAAGVGG